MQDHQISEPETEHHKLSSIQELSKAFFHPCTADRKEKNEAPEPLDHEVGKVKREYASETCKDIDEVAASWRNHRQVLAKRCSHHVVGLIAHF